MNHFPFLFSRNEIFNNTARSGSVVKVTGEITFLGFYDIEIASGTK